MRDQRQRNRIDASFNFVMMFDVYANRQFNVEKSVQFKTIFFKLFQTSAEYWSFSIFWAIRGKIVSNLAKGYSTHFTPFEHKKYFYAKGALS